jgi:hypothetical protein
VNAQEQEAKTPPKKYGLSGIPVFTKDQQGNRALHAIDITAMLDGKKQTIRHVITRDEAEILVGLLVDGVQKGINTFHALLRGEAVALGRHTADQLIQFGLPFRDLQR